MVRIVGIISLLLILHTSCKKEAEVVHPFSIDNVWEEMVVDFSIEILDSATGSIMLIDHCSRVDQLEWQGGERNNWFNIPDSYPGDTVYLELPREGNYVIEMTAFATGIADMNAPGDITSFKKSVVRSFELEDIFELEEKRIFTPYLSYIKLVRYPNLDKYALPWDADNSGPDVAISISYVYDDEYIDDILVDTVYQNLQNNELPISELAITNFSIKEISLSVEIEDVDTQRENRYLRERMALESFDISSLEIPISTGIREYNNKYISIGIEWK